MAIFVIIVAILATAAVVARFVLPRQHPEQAASHSRPGSDDTVTPTAERPAGPAAETMDPDLLGGDPRPPT